MMNSGTRRLEVADALDHFVTGFDWAIPQGIELGDAVIYWASEQEGPVPRVRPGAGILEDFLKLVRRPDQAVLEYARHWGPLWLCEHGTPWRLHIPDCGPAETEPYIEGMPERVYWERCEDWRPIAAEAAATIRIARLLHADRMAALADWETLRFLTKVIVDTLAPSYSRQPANWDELASVSEEDQERRDLFERLYPEYDEVEEEFQSLLRWEKGPRDEQSLSRLHDAVEQDEFEKRIDRYGREQLADSLEFQRRMLSQVLNYWLELGGVKPRLDWREDKPEVQLGGFGLLGALAVQLLFDCSRTDGLIVCTSCGTPFLPAFRRPRRDRNPYCSDCGAKAAARDAAARYRQTAKYRATYVKWSKQRGAAS